MKRLVLTSFLAISLFCNSLTQAMSSDFYLGFLTASASITGLGIGFYCCYKKLTKQGVEKELGQVKLQLNQIKINQNQVTQKNQMIVASKQEHTFAAVIQGSLQARYDALQQAFQKCQKERDYYFSLNHTMVEGLKKSNQMLFIPITADAFEPFLIPDDFEALKKEGLDVEVIKRKGTYYVKLSAIISTEPPKKPIHAIWPSSAEPTSSIAIPAAGGSPNSSN